MTAALPSIGGFPRLLLVADPRFADDGYPRLVAQVVAGAKSGNPASVQEFWAAACSESMVVRP